MSSPGPDAGFRAAGDGGFGWSPTPPLAVNSVDLAAAPPEVVCPFDTATAVPRVAARTLRVDDEPVRAISIRIDRPRIRVRSFEFPAADAAVEPPELLDRAWSPEAAPMKFPDRTRIRPPEDVIKLQDRLHYLLQPSLESLLAERRLPFPFVPFDYQMHGVAFLYPRHAAILADEMGLGKTMQAITAVRLLVHRGEVARVVLICPKPLVSNWNREFHTWAPELPVLVVEGNQTTRRWQWCEADVPVKIANYELVHRDRELLAGRAEKRPWDLVVLDEAQRIKNRSGATSQSICGLRRRRSWALTGTPVENSAEDVVGIFEFLAPGFLSADMKPRRIGRTISDFVLRRVKDDVLKDLPPKMFRDAELQLTPEQWDSYHAAKDEGVLRLSEMDQTLTIQHVFQLVIRLKQICNFDPVTGASAKLERMEADLEEIAASRRKAIVFSQWVETLEALARHLDRFRPLQYHGRIPSSRRDAVIERFRNDSECRVLLMTYGAGGVGLNLQFANYVFLFDRWWNPAVEDQAINRAHRIGATDQVTVTRFLMLGTIEERIDRILQEKRELFDTIFSDTQPHQKLGLTQEEIFGLFDLAGPDRTSGLAA
jgi:SNF2 family DNA or RNA helicase